MASGERATDSKWSRSAVHFSVFLTGVAFMAMAIHFFGWAKSWTQLGIPAEGPLFLDMENIRGALTSLASGHDPYIEDPGDVWGRPLDYPMIWVDIARTLHWGDDRSFRWSVGLCLLLLVGCWGSLVYRSPSVWILLTIFSESNLFLVERANNDIVVFCLTYLSLLVSSVWLAALLIFFGVVLKIYPIFSCAHLLRNRTVVAVLLGLSAVYLYTHYAELSKIKAAIPSSGLRSYGSASLSVLFSTKFDVNLSPLLITLAHLVAVLLVLTSKEWLDIVPGQARDSEERRMFLAGGGVYASTFVLLANWDYRLVFLLLCVPFMLRLKRRSIRIVTLTSCLLASNPFLTQEQLGVVGFTLNILSKSFLFVIIASLIVRELWHELEAAEFGRSVAGLVKRLTSKAVAFCA